MQTEALTLLRYGLQPLAVSEKKIPLLKWSQYQKEFLTEAGLIEMFSQITVPVNSIGIITGAVSGYLEVIDVDTKYDLRGNLYTEFLSLIKDNLPEVASSLVIGQTRSGGYHLYYRCPDLIQLPKLPGNTKLANREATAEEKAASNEKLLVLIETRGEGGYVVAPPTAGYTIIQGDLSAIPVIDLESRNYLIAIARSLTEYIEPETRRESQKEYGQSSNDESNPFVDYNQRGDVVALLEKHGWTFVKTEGQKVHFKRPGQSDAKTSGNFHEGHRTFFVWSSSTEFPEQKGISPASVYVQLECNGDTKEARRRLLADGYGKPGNYKKKTNERVRVDSIRVESSNADGEQSDLSEEGYLNEETVKEANADAAYIYYTAEQATTEVIAALDLLERSSTAKIYLIELSDLNNRASVVQKLRAYEFRAYDIMRRYDEAGGLDIDIVDEDRLLKEFVTVGLSIESPLERGFYEDLILRFSETNQLPITKQTLVDTLDKIHYDTQKAQQREAITNLLKEAGELNKVGEMKKALSELQEQSKKISAITSKETFRALVTPVSESDIAAQLKSRPADILTGYYLGEPESNKETPEEKAEREIRLPAGAISIIAGATSHGKTAFLLNFAVNAATNDLTKNYYVLGFEESGADMTIRAMNAYINTDFGRNNRRIIASHYRNDNSYFRGNTYKNFAEKKQEFFSSLIEGGRLSIQSVDYDSDTLMDAIRYLHNEGNAGGVFIDYMQLLRKESWKQSRQEELKRICMDLKDVAKDTGLPIVLAAQFNRTVINAAKMHPTNIGEAGDIERVANVILGLWNNDKRSLCSDDDTKELNERMNYRATPGLVYVDLLKNRGGRPQLDGMLNFNGNTGVLSNYERPNFSMSNQTDSLTHLI
ncbi:hypothetical protein GCM10027592_63190 [Spirosoma flavus]